MELSRTWSRWWSWISLVVAFNSFHNCILVDNSPWAHTHTLYMPPRPAVFVISCWAGSLNWPRKRRTGQWIISVRDAILDFRSDYRDPRPLLESSVEWPANCTSRTHIERHTEIADLIQHTEAIKSADQVIKYANFGIYDEYLHMYIVNSHLPGGTAKPSKREHRPVMLLDHRCEYLIGSTYKPVQETTQTARARERDGRIFVCHDIWQWFLYSWLWHIINSSICGFAILSALAYSTLPRYPKALFSGCGGKCCCV